MSIVSNLRAEGVAAGRGKDSFVGQKRAGYKMNIMTYFRDPDKQPDEFFQ